MKPWSLPAATEPRRRSRSGASARSFLRTIIGEYMRIEERWTWTQTLVRALALFGFDAATARQALVRTAATDDWLERQAEGRRVRWRLSRSGWRATAEAHARVLHFESGRTEWDEKWLLLVIATRDDRSRMLLRRRLGWAGFGMLPSGQAMISPHVEREADARRILARLGLEDDAVSFAGVAGAIGVPRHEIGAAWDLAELERRYRKFIARVKTMRPQSQRDVFIAHATLVHEWRRLPYFDPGLPLDYLPAGWIGREAKVVFDDRYRRWLAGANRWFAELDQASDESRSLTKEIGPRYRVSNERERARRLSARESRARKGARP